LWKNPRNIRINNLSNKLYSSHTQVWESCIFTAEEEKDFVKNYLGPTLHENQLGDVKLMIWDQGTGYKMPPKFLYIPGEAGLYMWLIKLQKVRLKVEPPYK
ncbi:MAG: hypothetical protein ACTSQ8_23125, partial [Candidatus Helarchaeota archaeon]